MKKKFVVVAMTIAAVKTMALTIAAPMGEFAQTNPTVQIVSLVGCVETTGEA